MHKLLRGTPSGPVLCTATLGNSTIPSLSIPFTKSANFLPLQFKSKNRNNPFFSYLPPPRPPPQPPKNRNCCRICRCLMDNTDLLRAWVVLKESRTRSRSAWFHTASDRGFLVTSAAAESEGSKSFVEDSGEIKKGFVEDQYLITQIC